jgi:hypothetical protein
MEVRSYLHVRNPPTHAGSVSQAPGFTAQHGMHKLRRACADRQRAVRTQRKQESKGSCAALPPTLAGSRADR